MSGHNETKSFTSKSAAKAWAKAREVDISNGATTITKASRSRTVATAIADYRQDKNIDDSCLFRFWTKSLGHVKLQDLTTDMVEFQLRKLRTGNKDFGGCHVRPGDKPRSPATINRYRSALSRSINKFVRPGGIAFNPVSVIPKLPEVAATRYLSEEERPRLLNACKQSSWPGLYVIVIMALSTGARRGELANLRWEQVDLQVGLIYLEAPDTKSKRARTLILLPEVARALEDYAIGDRTGLVFPSARKPDKPRHFEKVWQTALADADIQDFTFHSIRHSAASLLVSHGVSIAVVSEILGHSSLEMTKRYSHLSVVETRAATELAMKNLFSQR